MKKILPILFALFTTLTFAQQPHIPCLYDLAVDKMDAEYPGYKDRVNEVFQNAKDHVTTRGVQEVYTIPVIVHVVWKNPEEDIPLEQIEAQIAVLNQCFRRQNPDTINTRAIFHPVVADAGVEFVLADVIRVETQEEFQPSLLGGLPDHVKITADGGSDAIDPEAYMNIWVCAIKPLSIFGFESPVLGYAYPPADLANWPPDSNAPELALEGVVVDYRAFGDSLTYSVAGMELPIRGRTTTHEVGHYLGLRHISGDGQGAILGIPDCDADDGVEDTPNQGTQSQFDCNASQNTCDEGMGDLPDMVENYMDYSSETCQNSFTQGQADIVRAVLEGPRAGLVLPLVATTAADALELTRIYPNPTQGSIHWNIPAELGAYTSTLFDLQGKLLRQTPRNTGQLTIDMQQLPAGIYVLHTHFEDGRSTVRKVVKQ